MSNGVNKVIIVGNLGKDPEVKSNPIGLMYARLSVATTFARKDETTGQLDKKTEWHRVVVFGASAKYASQYLHKGSTVYVEGRLQTNKWQDKDGNDRYTTEIMSNDIKGLDKRQGDVNGNVMSPQAQPMSHTVVDDDIPF